MELVPSITVDGVRLSELADELPLGRSSLFELIRGLGITTQKGPGAGGKGRVAWVSTKQADLLRESARAVHHGEKRISDFTVALESLRTPPTISKKHLLPSTDSTDPAPFLARLKAAEHAVSSGLGLTTAETAWLLGVYPGSSPLTRGGITATRTAKNCWLLSRLG